MNDKLNDGGPAFPVARGTDNGPQDGMTLRDYFAAKVLQGLCANPGDPFQANARSGWGFMNCTAGEVAALANALADEMLKARAAAELGKATP